MSVISAARGRLVGDATLRALIGENVYPLRVPKNINPQPSEYIVIQTISDLADNHLEGWSGLDAVLLQMACIAPSFDRADAIRTAARNAITAGDDNDFRSRALDARDLYLPDIERQELQQDIAIWFRAL